ncbi:hypothetical protein [Sphingobacterium paludis]|nr:hypothetical protein [Sphingobacterium paludis]
MSALILGMAALTTTTTIEVKAQPSTWDSGDYGTIPDPPPAYPLPVPYPGGPTPWDWKPWQNPLGG